MSVGSYNYGYINLGEYEGHMKDPEMEDIRKTIENQTGIKIMGW